MTASDLLRRLVRFPSLSHHEGDIASFVEALGREHGLTVWRRDHNVVWELGEGDTALLFNSHLDVVPPSEAMPHGAFDAYEEDGVLWGRGTVDAKASGAAMLAAMLALKAEGWTPHGGKLLVALTACEELGGGYNGLEALRPHLPPLAGALVGEPTELQPCLAQKGLLILHVDAHGRTAHAARAHLGENAIWKLASDLERLRALTFEREDPFFGFPTLTPTILEAGTARNVVPDRARVSLDLRTTPAYTHDELTKIVQAAVEGEVIVHSKRYVPVSTSKDARIVQAVRAAHPDGVPFGSPTASDWTFLADVPTVKIGPGPSERSHTPDERIELWKVDEAARVYAATARAFFESKPVVRKCVTFAKCQRRTFGEGAHPFSPLSTLSALVMKKTLLLAALSVTAPAVFGQSLFVDNFAYADSLTVGGTLSGNVSATNATTGWATHSGTINQIKAGATFNRTLATTPAYPSQSGSGIELLASRGEDISHQFTQQTADGTVIYASAIVTPTAVPNGVNGSYFMHLSINTLTGTGYVGRVWAAAGATPGTVKYGVSAVSNAPVFASGEFALGTSVLLVLKYEMVAGASNNVASLYTLPAGSDITTEPGAPDATQTSAGTDPANIAAIALRQGTTTTGTSQNTGSMMIDGVRVGLTWNDAPLPVELNAFAGQANGTSARLAWTTASETNNLGFYVEQQAGESWNTVSGLVAGRGTTTERNTYAYTVDGLTAGTHTFRLRQVDTDGTVHYSPTTSVEIGVDGEGRVTLLGQRAVRVETNGSQAVSVSVYDVLGRSVSSQDVTVDGTAVVSLPSLSSGAYLVRVVGEGFATTKTLVVR